MVVGDRLPFIARTGHDRRGGPAGLERGARTRGRHPGGAAAEDPALVADIQLAIDDANRAVSKAESIRVFRILPSDFTRPTAC
jgi:long-chain acyl-CoA synthetase